MLTGTTTPGQSGPESNGNKEILHIPLFIHNPIAYKYILKRSIGPIERTLKVLPLQVRVDLEIIVMKRNSTLPKTGALPLQISVILLQGIQSTYSVTPHSK